MREQPARHLEAVRPQPGGPALRPRDAATLILLDRSGADTKVLMGRRHQRHVFMPGKFVFPGGRVEPYDARMEVAAPLPPTMEARLLKRVQRPSPGRARALALAAIRETFEETGLLVGKTTTERPAAPADSWRFFAEAGIRPDLSALQFVARAVTPPGRVRRFDTRFFAADAGAVARQVDGVVGDHGEFVELAWVPLTEVRHLELVTITRVIVEELETRIAAGLDPDLEIPFYRMLHGRFVREVL